MVVPDLPNNDTWACRKCTLHNATELRKCAACGSVRIGCRVKNKNEVVPDSAEGRRVTVNFEGAQYDAVVKEVVPTGIKVLFDVDDAVLFIQNQDVPAMVPHAVGVQKSMDQDEQLQLKPTAAAFAETVSERDCADTTEAATEKMAMDTSIPESDMIHAKTMTADASTGGALVAAAAEEHTCVVKPENDSAEDDSRITGGLEISTKVLNDKMKKEWMRKHESESPKSGAQRKIVLVDLDHTVIQMPRRGTLPRENTLDELRCELDGRPFAVRHGATALIQQLLAAKFEVAVVTANTKGKEICKVIAETVADRDDLTRKIPAGLGVWGDLKVVIADMRGVFKPGLKTLELAGIHRTSPNEEKIQLAILDDTKAAWGEKEQQATAKIEKFDVWKRKSSMEVKEEQMYLIRVCKEILKGKEGELVKDFRLPFLKGWTEKKIQEEKIQVEEEIKIRPPASEDETVEKKIQIKTPEDEEEVNHEPIRSSTPEDAFQARRRRWAEERARMAAAKSDKATDGGSITMVEEEPMDVDHEEGEEESSKHTLLMEIINKIKKTNVKRGGITAPRRTSMRSNRFSGSLALAQMTKQQQEIQSMDYEGVLALDDIIQVTEAAEEEKTSPMPEERPFLHALFGDARPAQPRKRKRRRLVAEPNRKRLKRYRCVHRFVGTVFSDGVEKMAF